MKKKGEIKRVVPRQKRQPHIIGSEPAPLYTPERKPQGRPSLYRPEFCDMLVKHMAQGYSFESFGAICHAHRGVLYVWLEVHPEFNDAKKQGQDYSYLFWENVGIDGVMGRIPFFNPAGWIFNMKNRFNWRDQMSLVTSNDAPIKTAYDHSKPIPIAAPATDVIEGTIEA